LTPPSGGTPCIINIIYTSLKSTFSALQFCRRHYGSIYLMKLLRDQGLPSKELHCIFHALVVSKIRYAMPAWSGFLSANLVGQINGLLKRAHRHGFTLDVISVEDTAKSADSKLFKSITHSNHCLHFLLPPCQVSGILSPPQKSSVPAFIPQTSITQKTIYSSLSVSFSVLDF